ncbi:hypothetical protein [Lentzea sp. NPDC004782]|uniref:hypothetical protein n=1 Tax=Lentzea sp. NPDC004782 TaxID=3154458 RepID=UPI00339EFE0F
MTAAGQTAVASRTLACSEPGGSASNWITTPSFSRWSKTADAAEHALACSAAFGFVDGHLHRHSSFISKQMEIAHV